MTTPGRTFGDWAPAVALALTASLYLARLDYSPVYLLNDEVYNALQSLSLASTGRSVAGDYLPVYFRGLEFPPGRDPFCIYATALALKLLPVAEATLRLPTALVGMANVVLAYLIGRRLFVDRRLALLTGAAVALAPAHYINSRIGIPTLWSTPWLLGWFLGLVAYAQDRRERALFVACACLGAATYGYLGTAVLVPAFYVVTIAFLYFSAHERHVRPYVIASAGLALPLLVLVYWHVLHPERWSELAEYYVESTAVLREGAPLFTSSGRPNFAGIQDRVTAYWNYFNPTLLFLSGDESPRYSTGRIGVFLLPAVILLPIGLYRAAHSPGIGRLLVACCLVAPVAGAVSADVQIQRALPLVAFGALLCAWGAASLLSDPRTRARRAGLLLCVLGAVQFGAFAYDYFGHYRLRSGAWRGGNLRGVFERVIAAARERDRPVLYLDENIDNIGAYWRFYAVAFDAIGLRDKAQVVDPAEVTSAPAGALFITGTQKGFTVSPADPDAWHLRERIYELDGPTFFSVFEKLR
jgi:hypothetical protein